MKRLFNLAVLLSLLFGLAWWQRAYVAPWIVRTVPASEPYVAAIPGFAAALRLDAPGGAGVPGGEVRKPGEGTAPVPVRLARAAVRQVPVVIAAVGTATPYASIQLRSRIDNTAVTSVRVAEGAEVEQGDILFTLDDRTISAQIAQIEAQIEKDTAQIAQAEHDLSRADSLLSRHAGAVTTRDTAATALKIAQAQLAADRATLASAQATRDDTVIRAPVSGRIGSIPVRPGSSVRTSDAAPLATVNQLDPSMVAFSIPQDRLVALREAMASGPVRVDVTAGRHTLTGKVAFIENAIDPATGTILVKADIPNERNLLWGGAFVKVEVVFPGTAPQVVVPSAAVQIGQNGSYVFVVEDAVAHLRPVTVARVAGADAVLSDGVADGEQVASEGMLRLVDGAPVSAKAATDTAAVKS
ncbi:efflux RND transporter periplasmic adaptor subunit [Labrys monachus]|uniref:Multidrug efflux system membrane fusion protein n=1 Tax=Labrys monachus TaxID=217067 RepID=A0ABU0FLX6_9HYPH|nr:efflux RND transporter periplasmic adaptor subunit [Labrys monachus]MDQ0395608.1 multidrug efflux system membrane fusion protein [Labrys monachus]